MGLNNDFLLVVRGMILGLLDRSISLGPRIRISLGFWAVTVIKVKNVEIGTGMRTNRVVNVSHPFSTHLILLY